MYTVKNPAKNMFIYLTTTPKLRPLYNYDHYFSLSNDI